jgi:amino acid transporter
MIPASFALSALTFADYILQPFFPTCTPPETARLLLGAASIIILTFINCVSVKWSNIFQNIFSLGKVAGLLLLIAFGAYSMYMGNFENFKNPFENTTTHPGNVAIAFHAGLYSYSGWSFLNYVVEEIKNPNKVLPLSIFFGLGVVIVIYLLANVAYFTLLTPREMINSSAVAFTFAEKLIGEYSWIVSIFVALSSLGYINGALFSASRTIFGAARNHHMPFVLAFIHIKFLTPITSILFMGFASLICLFIKDTFVLLKLTMLSEYIFIGGTVAGLLYLRRKDPKRERPIKVIFI